jgi:hypothetical protein
MTAVATDRFYGLSSGRSIGRFAPILLKKAGATRSRGRSHLPNLKSETAPKAAFFNEIGPQATFGSTDRGPEPGLPSRDIQDSGKVWIRR